MKLNFTKIALCLSAGVYSAGALGLQRVDVMADPAWLLHLDCDALRPTTIGQYVLAEMDKSEAKAKLAAFQSIFNFDLRTQLHGLTLYGGTQRPEDGVLIVYADFEPERLVTLAKAAKDYKSSEHNKHVIHNWIDDQKKGRHKTRVYAAIEGKRVLFGQREESVAAALDVLDGTSSNLSSTKAFSELGLSGSGRFIEGAARKMPLPEGDPNAAVLKLSKSAQLVMGEKDQQFQGALTLVADNDDVAGHILSIAQGMVALGKLQTNKLATALSLAQDGASVVGNLSLPASDVVDMLKADAARKAARKSKESKD